MTSVPAPEPDPLPAPQPALEPTDGPAIEPAEAEQQPSVDWPQVLDQLEEQVDATEDMLADARAEEIAAWGPQFADWVPPSSIGPLPEELRERAARLLQQQLAVAERLVERITQSQRQRDVAARMIHGPSRPVPSFIDQAL